jgi:hypothetical protein
LFAIAAMSAPAFGLASWAVPRVTLASAGWIRHLPLSRAQHEVALIAAVACAEAPLVAAALGAASSRPGAEGRSRGSDSSCRRSSRSQRRRSP